MTFRKAGTSLTHRKGSLQAPPDGTLGMDLLRTSFTLLWRVLPSLRPKSVHSDRAPALLKSFVVVVICRLEVTIEKMQCNRVPRSPAGEVETRCLCLTLGDRLGTVTAVSPRDAVIPDLLSLLLYFQGCTVTVNESQDL